MHKPLGFWFHRFSRLGDFFRGGLPTRPKRRSAVPRSRLAVLEMLEDRAQPAPVATITMSNPNVTEGGAAQFGIVLSEAPVGADVVVGYQTIDGTATAGSDYVAANGIVVFHPNDQLTPSSTRSKRGERGSTTLPPTSPTLRCACQPPIRPARCRSVE